MMIKARRQLKETLPWNPWKDQGGTVYGSLESLPRSAQQDVQIRRPVPKFFNPWIFLSVFGGGALSVLVVCGIFAAMMVRWTHFSTPSKDIYQGGVTKQLSVLKVAEERGLANDEFKVVKGKLHQFFSSTDLTATSQPLMITESELNAILKHDTRLGLLHDTITARIKDGRIQTAFDIKFGGLSLFGGTEGRLKGMGTFRVGLYAGELKVAIESLNINNRSMYRWLHYVHNMGVGELAKSGMKKLVNVPLKLLGEKGLRTAGDMRPILATFNLSKASTGDVFESMAFQGDGIMNMFAEPVQLFAINELFDVHSRLRDLVKSLDRVEVEDGVIMLYPRASR